MGTFDMKYLMVKYGSRLETQLAIQYCNFYTTLITQKSRDNVDDYQNLVIS